MRKLCIAQMKNWHISVCSSGRLILAEEILLECFSPDGTGLLRICDGETTKIMLKEAYSDQRSKRAFKNIERALKKNYVDRW